MIPAVPDGGVPPVPLRAFIRYAWTTLAVTILVIIWGAVVRATGSGAGCGSHWPLCNGDVLPLDPTTDTVIEFVHRITSGGVMILALGLLLWTWRLFPVGHQARRWARTTFIFMLIEAAIGAGIVLLELVGDNTSMARAAYVGGHLVNTLLLVGAMLTTIWWARRQRETSPPGRMFARPARDLTLALLALLVVAATGAVVALGDTLFPHASLSEGIAAVLDASSHILIRLRIWHPVMAALTAIWLLALASRGIVAARAARLIVATVLAQTALGVVNLLLLAPLALQMAHLVMSNLLWMVVVWTWLDQRQARPVARE
jgi:cytochrome c oxidase assembly protein subunit 15